MELKFDTSKTYAIALEGGGAKGAYEAGVTVVASYPGTPSTEITKNIVKYDEIYAEWAPNEKVAMEAAFGASLAGRRSFCGMKHVGLNVAADPLFTISYTGVNAGMVIGVADDAGMHSSQNEQDSRHYAMGSKTMMLEPSDSAECLEYTKKAFELSEKFDTPVIIRLTTRVAHSRSAAPVADRVDNGLKEYVKNPQKYVMMPANAKGKHVVVEQRILDQIAYCEEGAEGLNTVEYNSKKIGVITSGICYQYAKEVYGEEASILKLGMVWPLPEKMIKDFASKELKNDDITECTLILTMERKQKEKVLANFENTHIENVYALADFVDDELETLDPYGGNLQSYGLCYESLHKSIEKLVNILN